jgi:AcrR family transcriptional regulator
MTKDNPSPLIWMRPEPSGRKPRFSREQIARTAIAIADAEGFDAVTMKRIATELGAGTMTLYYYVRTKSDIVALMQDAILADVLIPAEELPTDWREALVAISRRTREVMLAHPWSLTSLNEAQFGPNASRHYEQSLAAIASLDLPTARRIELIGIFDNYVAGNALNTVESLERIRTAAANPRLVTDAVAYGARLLASGDFPQLSALSQRADGSASQEGPPSTDSALDRQFEAGLAALIAGVVETMKL